MRLTIPRVGTSIADHRWLYPLALALAVVVSLPGPSLPVPLYVAPGCAPEVCAQNIPRIPLLPFLAAAAFQLLVDRTARARVIAGRALLLGALGVMLAGLGHAARIPFSHDYFGLPYRIYAVAFLVAVTGVVAAWAVARRRPSIWATTIAEPLLAIAIVAGLASLLEGARAVGMAALAGVVVGSLAARARLRSPVDLRDPRLLLIGVVALAFAFRLIFGLQLLARSGPGMAFALNSDDGDSYYLNASRLAADPGRLSEVLAGGPFPPFYSLFLAGVFALTRENMAVVIVLQAALQAAAAAAIYALFRPLAGTWAALLGALLFAVDSNLIQNQTTLTAEALLVPAVLGSLVCFSRYAQQRSVRWLAAGALAVGIAFITRNVAGLALLAGASAWIAILQVRRWRYLLRDLAIVWIGFTIATLPIAVATYARDGTVRIVSQSATIQWAFEGDPAYTISNRFFVDRGIMPFTDPVGSVQRLLSEPLGVVAFYAQAIPNRLSTLLFVAGPGASDPLYVVNPVYDPNPYGDGLRVVRLTGLLVALVAMARLRPWRSHPELGVVLGLVIAYLAVFLLIFPPYHAFRYRIPMEPFRFVAEAAGIVLLARYAVRVVEDRQVVSPTVTRAG